MSSKVFLALPLLAALGCGQESATLDNPFGDPAIEDGKNDTGWQSSLDAAEVEITLEGDVSADDFSLERAPLDVGQFALTYLRKHNDVFLQSLAEDFQHGTDSIEWKVGDAWKKLADVTEEERGGLSRFRMQGVSAIVLHPGDRTALAKKVFTATVPKSPSTLFSKVGKACGTKDGSIDVEDGVYWYVWDPEKSGCNADRVDATATVTKVMPKGGLSYPEYDRLLADKRIDALVLFGQVEHGALSNDDLSFELIAEFTGNLERGGFTKAEAPLGLRYTRTKRGVTEVVDIYGPREFAGLDDFAHVNSFDAGVRSHEIVVWNGHSMLGASDFWARPSIYSGDAATKYQIFLYNGCLGYEYYVNPILEGKKGWGNVDLVSNVIETPFAIMVDETSSVLSRLFASAERGGTTSWQSLLEKMNDIAGGDSFYGASGTRENAFHPAH